MSQSKKKHGPEAQSTGSADAPPPDKPPPKKPGGKKTQPRWWHANRHPVLRFVLLFAILMGAFEIWFISSFSKGETFKGYLRLTARTCSTVLDWMGNQTRVSGASIISPKFSVRIVRGCDALEPSVLFLAAVAAFPASILSKVTGMALGAISLQCVNIVRITSLFYIGIYCSKETFDRMHYEVWQAVFIFLALLFWLIWARWATRPETVPSDGSA